MLRNWSPGLELGARQDLTEPAGVWCKKDLLELPQWVFLTGHLGTAAWLWGKQPHEVSKAPLGQQEKFLLHLPPETHPAAWGSLSRDLHILQQMVLQEKEPITSSSLPGSKKDGLVTHEGKRRFLLLKDFLLQNHIIQWKKCQE